MTVSCAPYVACCFHPEKRFSWRLVGVLLVAPVLLLSLNSDACGEPPKYENMFLKSPLKKYYEAGEDIRYQCLPGYIAMSSVVTYCEQNHSWYPIEEACYKKECTTPRLENGEVYAPNYSFQFENSAYFYCNEGYYLSGKQAIICHRRGDDVYWGDEFPTCHMVKCEYPVVEHGRMVSGIKNKYSYQATVLFECLPGFYLNGSNPVFCGGNSTWEPEMPKCIRGFKPTYPTKPPVSKYPGYPEPSDRLTLEDFEELDAGIIAVIVLTLRFQ
ncbi:membrane cofactor protein-like isoform X2 [Neovison vison]|uniref:membrane cofactor protein-like isoform X2 n=1 Tax=Neovison vison TaxID=452646 RepID=UPI001CF08698|nr:membrane cofactor protein-like isoform X2 [Neogale vison]